MSISGLRKASWYNPDTGTVVQANDIAEDGEFYTRAIEDPDDQTATGESPYAGDESYCELMVFDMSLKSQLEAWEENDTRISMVAAGVQQNIQWYERDLVSVKPVYPVAAGRRNHLNVVMERTGHGAHDIYGHVNLLAHLGTTADPWTDADGDGIADGYDIQGETSLGFASNVQGFDTQSDGTLAQIRTLKDVLFPISGIDVVFSSKAKKIHTDQTEFRLVSEEYSGTPIQDDTLAFDSSSRRSINQKTSTLHYAWFLAPLRVPSPSAEETVRVIFPVLRVDGSDKYVSY